VPLVRARGASVSVEASSCLLRLLLLLDAAGRPADKTGDAEDQTAPAGDGDWLACRTDEPGTTGNGTGASRSGQRSPDDVIGSPGHPARVVLTLNLHGQNPIHTRDTDVNEL